MPWMRNLKFASRQCWKAIKRKIMTRTAGTKHTSSSETSAVNNATDYVCKSRYYSYSVPTFFLKTSQTLRNFLFFFFVFFLSKRHQTWSVFFCLVRTWAPPSGRRLVTVGCHRAKINSDRKMADLRKVCPESLPCRVNYSRKPSFQWKLFIFLCILLVDSGGATTHWVVTEDGKIQQQVWRLTLVWSLTCKVASL